MPSYILLQPFHKLELHGDTIIVSHRASPTRPWREKFRTDNQDTMTWAFWRSVHGKVQMDPHTAEQPRIELPDVTILGDRETGQVEIRTAGTFPESLEFARQLLDERFPGWAPKRTYRNPVFLEDLARAHCLLNGLHPHPDAGRCFGNNAGHYTDEELRDLVHQKFPVR